MMPKFNVEKNLDHGIFFYNCGNQDAHEKWNARKWCSKTEEQNIVK